jgi:hypothetical protein
MTAMGAEGEIVARAKNDLARRRGISPERIFLRHAETVTWPDASLGCPLPNRMYAQVLTPGYRLVLTDGITDYEYHTDNFARVVFCRAVDPSNTK